MTVVKHWNKSSGEALELSRAWLDIALSTLAWLWSQPCFEQRVGLDDPWKSFPI